MSHLSQLTPVCQTFRRFITQMLIRHNHISYKHYHISYKLLCRMIKQNKKHFCLNNYECCISSTIFSFHGSKISGESFVTSPFACNLCFLFRHWEKFATPVCHIRTNFLSCVIFEQTYSCVLYLYKLTLCVIFEQNYSCVSYLVKLTLECNIWTTKNLRGLRQPQERVCPEF